ncbi:MAG TPA: putative quinol monooxygenase [Candidatus Acidoferrum sp.]|jgi:quinol monooxygenase YgiN
MAKKRAKRSGAKRKVRRSRKPIANDKLPKNAVTLAVILRPRDGQDMMLEAELRALIAPTRKEEGCLRYDLHRSLEGPTAFLLHEIWETREHHTAHTKTDHFLRWNARKDALLASREVGFWKQIV